MPTLLPIRKRASRSGLSDRRESWKILPGTSAPELDAWSLLVVDAAASSRRSLAACLRHPEIAVQTTASAAVALRRVRRQRIAAAFVSLDVEAGGALDLLARLRAQDADMVLALVGGAEDLETRRAAIQRARVDLFVPRPWDVRMLRESLRLLLDPSGRRLRFEADREPRCWHEQPIAEVAGSVAATAATQIVLARLASEATETGLRQALMQEFRRLVPAQAFAWLDEDERVLRHFGPGGEARGVEPVEALSADSFRSIERARRAAEPFVEPARGGSAARLWLPLRARGRDLALFGVAAERGTWLCELPREVARCCAAPAGGALERARESAAAALTWLDGWSPGDAALWPR